ncbi:MAG: hypothetical protein ABI779_00450 [Acidobacteriota bacterium]
MVPLSALWLPILVSAVFVFIASNILWMGLPFWHYRDYKRLPDDKVFVDGARSLKAGLYVFPWMDWKTMTPEQKADAQKGPSAMMIVRNPAVFSFGKTLSLYFLYCLLGSFMAAYVASATLAPGTEYLRVFRIAGAAGMLFWSFGTNVSDAIWYGKPWGATIKHIIDGLIFGMLIGGTFGWLWPA